MLKKLLPKLISYYKEHLEIIKKMDYYEIDKYLTEKALGQGICWCACQVFNEYIYTNININKPGEDSWFRCPWQCKNKKEVIKSLQFRVDKMKKILKTL